MKKYIKYTSDLFVMSSVVSCAVLLTATIWIP